MTLERGFLGRIEMNPAGSKVITSANGVNGAESASAERPLGNSPRFDQLDPVAKRIFDMPPVAACDGLIFGHLVASLF